ncbi:NmrA family transcriptional regulator [Conexibacter sp. CPCC 206217]|uniref:NmrA family transcriptional regulator n=1 Tax=Conexibacter sp. CPCC 206217 TaxID=3064574 RepID=UPI00272593F5|nr:NmrA family transcriptional regulator [Conexibacter sp. CPCC 206217]MDO8211181.1 NmrA family transcriptional regulator [Conexibacter sp. CPCC 206217]
MPTTQTDLILVTGGTGKTGRRIAERLASDGRAVRVGSRSGSPAFDWEDRATWSAALDGVSAAYLCYYPDLAVPGAAETVAAFAQLAAQRGVERLVLLSGRGEPEAERAEQLVREVGAETTVVRCAWFNQNFDESYFADGIAAGVLALPAGDVPAAFVDADDVADVAVAALTGDGHAGQLYDVTGPRPLTFAEAVAEIAQAIGRPARYVPISLEEFATGMASAGVPDDVISLLRYLFTEVLVQSNATLGDGVQRALGRPPRDFRDYARRAAAGDAWVLKG